MKKWGRRLSKPEKVRNEAKMLNNFDLKICLFIMLKFVRLLRIRNMKLQTVTKGTFLAETHFAPQNSLAHFTSKWLCTLCIPTFPTLLLNTLCSMEHLNLKFELANFTGFSKSEPDSHSDKVLLGPHFLVSHQKILNSGSHDLAWLSLYIFWCKRVYFSIFEW